MTISSISDSERSPSKPSAGAQSSTQAAVDRLAGLLPPEALEDALKGLEPDQITGTGGLLTELAGRVIETALGAELTEHLGHPPGGVTQGPNVRNGAGRKTVKTELGAVAVRTPRDRDGSFEPQLVGKRQTRLAGLDDRILGLYAGGMSVRDIEDHLTELYGVEIKRDTISRVTDAVLEDVAAWRTRPLDTVYAIAYFDCLMVKVREDRSVRTRACYLAIGVTCEGDREVLGIWWQETEGAKFWLAVRPPRRRRHPRLLRRRADRVPRGDRGGLPPGVGADLHRASDPRQHALRHLPGPQARGRAPEADLPRFERRRPADRAAGVR